MNRPIKAIGCYNRRVDEQMMSHLVVLIEALADAYQCARSFLNMDAYSGNHIHHGSRWWRLDSICL
eukprot:2968021-Amphidinium_carterae.1